MKLINGAQTWLIDALSTTSTRSKNRLLLVLKNQYGSTVNDHLKVEKFLTIKEVRNKRDFGALLLLADEIHQRRSIIEQSLIGPTIPKCPSCLRSLLVTHTFDDGN